MAAAKPLTDGAQPLTDGAKPGKSLSSDLNTILISPQLQSGIDGVMVADVRARKLLFAHNADKLLIPASNRKLFTAAAALALLGRNHREVTDLLATAPTDLNGTISGDLFLRGGGDPLLSVDDLDAIAAELAAKGVRRVVGGVIADSSLFTGSPWGDGWQVDSLLDYYSPEIAALEVNEGIASVALHGVENAGDPTTYDLYPQTSYYTVENHAITGAPGSDVVINRDRPLTSTHVVISGSIPVGQSPDPNSDSTDSRFTLPNPPLYAATILLERCRAHGIVVDGSAQIGVTPADAIVLASHASLPMAQMLGKMLKPSDNLIAECLTRLEAARPGHPGSYDEGRAIEDNYFTTLGIRPGTHLFADGSGESRVDFVTPRALLRLLLAEAKRPDFSVFYDAMSIVGVDGTGKNRMKGTFAASGNAHVKTGTVRNCRSFSGYVTDRSGRLLAFVILMNNHLIPARAMGAYQDRIVERLAENR